MVFTIKTDQALYLTSAALLGYKSIQHGLSSIQYFCHGALKALPASEKVQQFTNYFFLETKSGHQASQLKSQTSIRCLKKSMEHGLCALSLGISAYLFFHHFLTSNLHKPNKSSVEKVQQMQLLANDLLNETLPMVQRWKNNVCFNEVIQWESVTKIQDCLDPQNIDPTYLFKLFEYHVLSEPDHYSIASSQPLQNLTNETYAYTSCSNYVKLLAHIQFYKITWPYHQLKEVEGHFKRLLIQSKFALHQIRITFEQFLAAKYFGSWKQLWLGRLFSTHFKVMCNSIFRTVIDGLDEECENSGSEIEKYTLNFQQLKQNLPLVNRLIGINCTHALAWDIKEVDLKNFSLPNNFSQLAASNQFQQIADYFQAYGGQKGIGKMKFNFSAIPRESECEHGTEKHSQIKDRAASLYMRSARAAARNLNHKYRWLSVQDMNLTYLDSAHRQQISKEKGIVMI